MDVCMLCLYYIDNNPGPHKVKICYYRLSSNQPGLILTVKKSRWNRSLLQTPLSLQSPLEDRSMKANRPDCVIITSSSSFMRAR